MTESNEALKEFVEAEYKMVERELRLAETAIVNFETQANEQMGQLAARRDAILEKQKQYQKALE